MCGRYSLIGIDDLGNRFRIIDPTLGFRSHFNIAPGSTNPVIVKHERSDAVMMEWGLVPHWVKDRKEAKHLINARAETLAEASSDRKKIVYFFNFLISFSVNTEEMREIPTPKSVNPKPSNPIFIFISVTANAMTLIQII